MEDIALYFCKDNLSKDITIALAHEVKNPVSLIKANIELLELENVLDNHQKNVKMIKNQLNKITKIMSDFMYFCDYEHKDNKEDINIYYLIKEHIENLKIYKNIDFYIQCKDDIKNLSIKASYFKICIILSNIYKNCIEAIEKEKGFIKTKIYIKDKKLFIDFIDTGKGIEDNILNDIYKPFFTNKKNGTGLGIPICINIIKSLEGEFYIFNNKDKGCVTRIVLNI